MTKKTSKKNTTTFGFFVQNNSKNPSIEELRRKEAKRSKRMEKKKIDRFC